jgi:hypothetical protein
MLQRESWLQLLLALQGVRTCWQKRHAPPCMLKLGAL